MRDELGRFIKGCSPDATFRKKLSEGAKNRPPRPDVGAKISKALTGKKLTAEHRASISACQRGKKHSEETIRKMSEARKTYWDRVRGV